MFDHSVKVPRLYKNASKIVKEVSEGKGSIKQLVYESKHPNIKGLYALIVHAFQRTEAIEKLVKKSKLLIKEPRFDPWLAKILITELLWGKKRLTGESKPVKTILGYEQIFKAHLSDVSDNQVEAQIEKPRYVRINTIKISINEAVEGFRNEGWVLKRYTDASNYPGFVEAVSNLASEEFMVDLHIPYLLIFPPKTQFYQHPAYKNGSIILQDKASCLSVHILNPERGATIMDMCAAPGMKTTQTAAVIENEGLIYAVEIGTKRYETLTKIVESSGATCVKTINRDVLTLTGKDCPDVEYVLVDPSCSGSGLTDRIEIGQQKQDEDQARLSKLAGFQIKILRHALTRFPKVKKVVYSTCSVFAEENEDVVRQVLETCTKFKLVPANRFVKDAWINFGSSEFGDIGNYCLYAKPDIDLTSGFFVAVFERLGDGEYNQFLNRNLFPVKNTNYECDDHPRKKKKKVKSDEEETQKLEEEAVQTVELKKKRSRPDSNEEIAVKKETDQSNSVVDENGQKKKKSKHRQLYEEIEESNLAEIKIKKEKKSKSKLDCKEEIEDKRETEEGSNVVDENGSQKKKKKEHRLHEDIEESDFAEVKIKKKKKSKSRPDSNEEIEVKKETEEGSNVVDENGSQTKKKKKRLFHEEIEESGFDDIKIKKEKTSKSKEVGPNEVRKKKKKDKRAQ